MSQNIFLIADLDVKLSRYPLTKAQVKRRLEWADALESGRYQQTVNNLRDFHGYCCLGVAANEHSPNHWKENGDNVFEYIYNKEYYEGAHLPEHIARKYGLTYELENAFADANDAGTTFVQIATLIRKHSK
jgi:hypothetical protein